MNNLHKMNNLYKIELFIKMNIFNQIIIVVINNTICLIRLNLSTEELLVENYGIYLMVNI